LAPRNRVGWSTVRRYRRQRVGEINGEAGGVYGEAGGVNGMAGGVNGMACGVNVEAAGAHRMCGGLIGLFASWVWREGSSRGDCGQVGRVESGRGLVEAGVISGHVPGY